MSIKSYSTTPANNATATGINWAEGMPPSDVNNSARQMMADTREQWNDAEWFEYLDGTETGTITYVANNQFKVTGADVSSHYHIGRKVRIVGSLTGTIYQTITAVSYSAGDTTVTIDGTGLNNEALAVASSIISADNNPIPKIDDFESAGIDDNATSTQLTITDTTSTFGGNLTMSDGKLVQSDSLSGNTVATFANTSTTNPNGMYIATSNYAGNASNYLIRGANSGGNAFSIYTDGSADFADVTLSNGKLVQSDSLSGNTVATFANIASSNPNIMYMAVNNYAGNASNYFLRGDNSGGSAFNIYTDGSAYYSGGLYLGAKSSANLLDDYEEGTWTPVFDGQGASPTSITYSKQQGFYRKTGNLVIATCDLRISAITIGAASGALQVTGLPFIVQDMNFSAGCGVATGFVSGRVPAKTWADTSTTTSRLFYTGSTGDVQINVTDLSGDELLLATFIYFT